MSEVEDPLEGADGAIFACMPQNDPVLDSFAARSDAPPKPDISPDAIEGSCTMCGQAIWIGPQVAAKIEECKERHIKHDVFCMMCAIKVAFIRDRSGMETAIRALSDE